MKTAILVVLLAATLVLPAVASEVTITGWSRYGIVLPLDNSGVSDTRYIRLYATYKMDDFNTFYLQLYGAEQSYVSAVAATDTNADTNIDTVTVTTNKIDQNAYMAVGYVYSDLAKWLKLNTYGLGMILRMGKTSHSDAGYGNVTANSVEDVSVAGVGTDFMIGGDLSYSVKTGEKETTTKDKDGKEVKTKTPVMTPVATLEIGVVPKVLVTTTPVVNDYYFGIYTSQTASFGKISADVAYDGNKDADLAHGVLVASAAYEKSFGDLALKVGLGFNYNLAPVVAPATKPWNYEVGLKGTYGKIGSVAFTANGDNVVAFHYVVGEVQVNAIPNMALLAAARLNLDSTVGTELLNMLDVAARFDVGTADFYVGYINNNSASAKTMWSQMNCYTGGIYIRYELSY